MTASSDTAHTILAQQPTLAAFTSRAWDVHAEHPAAVASELQRRAEAISADADGAAAITLAEHVWLTHLNNPDALEQFLKRLAGAVHSGVDTSPAVERARWVLDTALGAEPSASPPEPARWRGLQNVIGLWLHRQGAARALALLHNELPRAEAHTEASARRAMAATCNNLAVELRQGPRGDARRDELMLTAANASRRLWANAGTWVHIERADYQLARCHAALGRAEPALAHARACLAAIDAHPGDADNTPFERFFAHEALAHAHRAAGDAAATATERGRMAALLAAVDDTELRAWCEEALADFDRAHGLLT